MVGNINKIKRQIINKKNIVNKYVKQRAKFVKIKKQQQPTTNQ